MANFAIPLPKDLVYWLYQHQFKVLEGANGGQTLREAMKSKEVDYQAVVKEISADIYEFLSEDRPGRKAVFSRISSKAKHSNGRAMSLPEYLEAGSTLELINWKTLASALENEKASSSTIKVLEAFRKVSESHQRNIKGLSRLTGSYNLFNVHGVGREKFQISNLHLNPQEESLLVYFSRRNELEEKKVDLEIIGADKLLISFRMDNCLMMFYAYMGSNNKAEVLIPAFFYNNSNGHTIASIAVLKKVNDKKPLAPKRNLDTTGLPAIDRFLKHKAPLLTAISMNIDGMQFNEEDLAVEPGPFRQNAQHYRRLSRLKGLYDLYFCERYPAHSAHIKNSFFSTVGRAVLRVFEDIDGVLRCQMKTLRNAYGEDVHYSGWIANETMKDSAYTIMNLFVDESEDRAVSLHLVNSSDDWLYGGHNTMYTSPTKIGAGAVVLHRIKTEQALSEEEVKTHYEERKPVSLLPNVIDTSLSEEDQIVLNYLSRIRGAHVSPVTSRSRLVRDNIHQGIYRMYSYGKSGIRIGILRIHATGFVEHVSVGGYAEEKIQAYGEARQVRQSLYIQLENKDNGRLGFCVFKTEGEVAPVKERIFTGTFCGVTRRNGEFPLASRLILEFVGKEEAQQGLEPAYIKYDDPRYEAIDPIIRRTFKGRSESMIGFLKDKSNILTLKELKKFNKSEIDKGAAFLSAAVYERVHGDGEDLAKQLLHRALKYGELEAEEAYQKKLQEQASILLERAAYQLLAKNDEQAALVLLQKANQISLSTLDLSTFKQDVAGAPALQRLVELPGYRELSGE